jgi:biotin carboxyl carrier protein/tRNA uridine 5-carbamoylmethylation protein Kti12
MSTGKIIANTKGGYPLKDEISKIVREILTSSQVEVDDTKWQLADEELAKQIGTDINKKAEEIDKKITEFEKVKQALVEKTAEFAEKSKDIAEKIRDLDDLRGKELLSLGNEAVDLVEEIEDMETEDEKARNLHHCQFPVLLKLLQAKVNIYLVGPTGSGKTYAARQCAKKLGVKFYFTGSVASEFKLTGFVDAKGKVVRTAFREAFEKGGLFLFDEIDGSYPQAVLAFNAALANDCMDFPDRRVKRHKDFYCIAAANTYGQGADRQYVGRNQLDAASLDRFVFVDWQYDKKLELELAGNAEWTHRVQKVRDVIEKLKIRHVVSPRASIYGAELLSLGVVESEVEKMLLWKGLDEAEKDKIIDNLTPESIKTDQTGTFIPKVKIGSSVERGTEIGLIEYTRADYYSTKVTVKIVAPFKGIIQSISSKKKKVKEGSEVASMLKS